MDILVVDEEVNEVKEKGTEKKLHGYERDDGTGKKNSFAKFRENRCSGLSHRIPPTLVIVQPGERKGCSFDTGHGFSRVSLVHAIQVKQYRAPLEGKKERERERKKRNLSPSGNNSSPFPPDVFFSYSPNDSSSGGGGEERTRNHFQATNQEATLPLCPHSSRKFRRGKVPSS